MTNLELWEQIFIDGCIDNNIEFDAKIELLKEIQKRLLKELTNIQ